LPNVEKHHARRAAHDFVSGQLGYEVDVDPLDGALMAVRMAAGARTYWLERLAECYEAGAPPGQAVVEGYRLAMQDLGRMSDTASKAGVAERLIAITERVAEQITLAFEEAAQAMKLDPETRALGVATFSTALAKLEQAPLMLGAGDD
jgi:hypothetical protein